MKSRKKRSISLKVGRGPKINQSLKIIKYIVAPVALGFLAYEKGLNDGNKIKQNRFRKDIQYLLGKSSEELSIERDKKNSGSFGYMDQYYWRGPHSGWIEFDPFTGPYPTTYENGIDNILDDSTWYLHLNEYFDPSCFVDDNDDSLNDNDKSNYLNMSYNKCYPLVFKQYKPSNDTFRKFITKINSWSKYIRKYIP